MLTLAVGPHDPTASVLFSPALMWRPRFTLSDTLSAVYAEIPGMKLEFASSRLIC